MKTNLKNIIGGAALGLALLTSTVPTWAGRVTSPPYEVVIGPSNAGGALQAARYSSDSKQYIGCAVSRSPSYWYISCSAVDKNGASFTCLTGDPRLISAARAMTGDSLLFFSAPAGSSTCNSVAVLDMSENKK